MAAPQNTSGNASLLKILLKKLFPSPSTRTSWYQIGKALSITVLIVGAIAWQENEQKEDKLQTTNQPLSQTKTDKLTTNNSQNNTLLTEIANPEEKKRTDSSDRKCKYNLLDISEIICLTSDLKLLAQAQNIAVISAALLFFFDTFDRKKQLERQAWQLIDGAQGAETSGARKQAIEDLYKEDADITGLDADGADLRGINLSRANLERASFKNAILEGANFQGANLKDANFAGANLKGADLRGALLLDADLTGADLKRLHTKNKNDKEIQITTKLQGARLRRAKLNNTELHYTEFGEYNGENTDLSHAQFRKANICFVSFKNTNIEGTFFGGATTGEDELKIEIISQADNYEKAFYSQSSLDKYSKKIGSLEKDKHYEEEVQLNISKIRYLYLKLSNDKDNISSLNLIELLNLLLECILVESTENTSKNNDTNKSTFNVIVSLKNKLTDLNKLVDSAQQEVLLAENKKMELDNRDKQLREKSNERKSEGEEIDRYIAQMQKNEE
jgi:uncharacterized protein YjbI with pentapeptide repeats